MTTRQPDAPAGEAAPSGAVPSIERHLDLVAPPDRIWRALTEPGELSAWFMDRVGLTLAVGAAAWLESDESGRFAIRIEALDAPRRLAWRWARDPDTSIDDGVSTLVEWWLEPSPAGGTTLRLRESGFVRDEDRHMNVERWLEVSAALAKHLATEAWHGGIRRTYTLRSAPARVWQAFADPAELAAWWGGIGHLEVHTGFEGWWDWPSEGGRFAMRFDAVEPPRYLAWSWATEPGVSLADTEQLLHTEWVLIPRADGGTDLRLFESGFRGPRDHGMNDSGWDGDVLPVLRKHLGEAVSP